MTRPRVLVTGGSGVFGLGTARWLDRLGVTPVLMARRTPAHVPAGAEFVAGDITDPADVRRAVQGVRSVIHLAWTVSALADDETTNAVDIGGTANLLEAMQDAGVGRLVFASSITAYGAHPDHPQPYGEHEPLRPSERFRYEANKARAEQMIADADLESVRVRPTVVVGRGARNTVTDVFSQPVLAMPPGDVTMQFVHQDDVGRFFASVALEGPTGPVNLAAEDAVPIHELSELLGRPLVQPPMGLMKQLAAASKATKFMEGDPELLDLFLYFPKGDVTRLHDDFGFRCAYSSREALADFGASIRGERVIGRWRFTKLTALADDHVHRFDPANAAGESLQILPDDVAGEFDDAVVDADYPEWTAANVGEAYPAPMTPLGLELAVDSLRGSGSMPLNFIGSVTPEIDWATRTKFVASHGHGVRVNLTLLRQINDSVPGQTKEQFDHAILGLPLPDDFELESPSVRDIPQLLGIVGRTTPKLLGMERQVDALVARAATVRDRLAGLAEQPDEVVLARLDQLWDETVKAWIVTGASTFMVSVPQATVERVLGVGAMAEISTAGSELMSVGPLRGVNDLRAAASAVPGLLEDLRAAPAKDRVDLLRSHAPVAAKLDRLVAEIGHRGPGEMELANDTYADRPELLVEAMLNQRTERAATSRPTSTLSRLERRLVANAHASMVRRERARDAISRLTQGVRYAAREWGARLVAQGTIDTPEDVFYLRRQELLRPPTPTREVIARRRAERERLAALDLPVTFDGPWVPADQPGDLQSGVITGLGVSDGVVRGKVRVLRSPHDDFEVGEILVTRVTDVGWTPLFGAAEAVVTDMGASMSHAAIVAREFGIPAVVGAGDASQRLRTGQTVEVDGAAGTITVIA